MKRNLSEATKRKEVAFVDNTVSIENLPYPIVYYPGFYGAFFGFQKNKNSPIVFCSCAKEAIENYIKLRIEFSYGSNAIPTRNYILDSMYFPYAVIEKLLRRKVPSDQKVSNFLKFEDKLCHECNRSVPSYKYCVPMYGGTFRQTFGWYINKKSFEYGISPFGVEFVVEACPEELVDILNKRFELWDINLEKLKKGKIREAHDIQKNINKLSRRINNLIEDEVRIKFKHRRIGEAWTSETILYYIIRKAYPKVTILRHYRPASLDYLELDIYIKEFGIGIEYQGIQHFRPIKYWGGESALRKTRLRDKRKKEMCIQNGIKLLYFYYNEDLSEDLVKRRIENIIK